ncbi:MAG: APC family permease [Mycobacteriales bacterium]
MSWLTEISKRVVLGRPLRSDRLGETLIPKRIALPVFASEALSSVAYAPEQILATLSIAGVSAYAFSPWIGVAVAAVMLTVVASYRQTVHAYPSGGGDYEVANTNLGPTFGLIVASALLVDYVLTVAVSISSGVANIASAVPGLNGHEVLICLVLIVVLAALNLRGARESGKAFALPTYGFIVGVLGMIAWGLIRLATGTHLVAETRHYGIHGQHYAGFALVFIVLRAFSSGSAALTGVEAISNGVPAFRKPKSKNAATTLLMMGLIAVTMLIGMIALGRIAGAKIPDVTEGTYLTGAPKGYRPKTLIAQIADTVFNDFRPGFYFVVAVTGIILVLAANTAFNGFPVLGSILARERYLPRQLHTRGDKLAYSNGILALGLFAAVLIVGFQASTTRLIQLYIVGVFVSFNCSQAGMIRHWNRHLRTERDPTERHRMRRSQTINTVGLAMTAVVLVIVLITKFTHGAYIAIIAMAGFFVLMRGIRRHYDRVATELAPTGADVVLPSRNHVVVLVSKVHKPALRALAFARVTRPDTLTALTVNVDDEETRALQAQWDALDLAVPLTIVESPFREITKPILDYVKQVRRSSPRDLVTVFIPEYVVGHWWEQLLHNQTALRLKGRLLFQPGVMVTNVPWQLSSSDRRKTVHVAADTARRGALRAEYARDRDAARRGSDGDFAGAADGDAVDGDAADGNAAGGPPPGGDAG